MSVGVLGSWNGQHGKAAHTVREQAMLSQYERRQLDQIERLLTASDPKLSRILSDGPPARNARPSLVSALALYTLGVFLVVLGAITLTFTLIGAGIAGLTIAACLHVSRCSRIRHQ